MTDKLHIDYEMTQLNLKNRDFFDELTDDEKKKFSPYLMIRWSASTIGSSEMEAYYLASCNERLNKNFFDISTAKHKKFQWLLATTVSPGMGKQRYKWLAGKKKAGPKNKTEALLVELYPHAKMDEIELMSEINTLDDIKQLARQHGWEDKKIKEYL